MERFPAPALEEGQLVVFDNLGAHRTKRVMEIIEAKRAEVLFVLSYSPDRA